MKNYLVFKIESTTINKQIENDNIFSMLKYYAEVLWFSAYVLREREREREIFIRINKNSDNT